MIEVDSIEKIIDTHEEIVPGDIVKLTFNYLAILTGVVTKVLNSDKRQYYVLYNDGTSEYINGCDTVKTGKHVELSTLLSTIC